MNDPCALVVEQFHFMVNPYVSLSRGSSTHYFFSISFLILYQIKKQGIKKDIKVKGREEMSEKV